MLLNHSSIPFSLLSLVVSKPCVEVANRCTWLLPWALELTSMNPVLRRKTCDQFLRSRQCFYSLITHVISSCQKYFLRFSMHIGKLLEVDLHFSKWFHNITRPPVHGGHELCSLCLCLSPIRYTVASPGSNVWSAQPQPRCIWAMLQGQLPRLFRMLYHSLDYFGTCFQSSLS